MCKRRGALAGSQVQGRWPWSNASSVGQGSKTVPRGESHGLRERGRRPGPIGRTGVKVKGIGQQKNGPGPKAWSSEPGLWNAALAPLFLFIEARGQGPGPRAWVRGPPTEVRGQCASASDATQAASAKGQQQHEQQFKSPYFCFLYFWLRIHKSGHCKLS